MNQRLHERQGKKTACAYVYFCIDSLLQTGILQDNHEGYERDTIRRGLEDLRQEMLRRAGDSGYDRLHEVAQKKKPEVNGHG